MGTTTSLQLKGRSGCTIEIETHGNKSYVRKSATTEDYNQRLFNQAIKQKKSLVPEGFLVPQILYADYNSTNKFFLEMEYVYGEKFSNYLQGASVGDIKTLIKKLQDYFTYEINMSNTHSDPTDSILNKLNTLLDTTSLQPLKKKVLERFRVLPKSSIPIGYCHGDFTFSNMLFTKNKIFLFDFLDSFIESPILDMVKIRQDTEYYWSVLIDHELEPYKLNKVISSISYINTELLKYFNQFDWYVDWSYYFEVLNLLRILPYLTDEQEKAFINLKLYGIINI